MCDFLPCSTSFLQLDAISVQNRIGMYSPWSRAGELLLDVSEMHRGAPCEIRSIIQNDHHQLRQPCRAQNVTQTCQVESVKSF